MDNNGSIIHNAYLITVPDQGFDIVPVFTENIDGSITVREIIRSAGLLPPHLVPAVTTITPALTSYAANTTCVTNYRTTFIMVVRRISSANYPENVIISWRKK